jgi:hypothetical protein
MRGGGAAAAGFAQSDFGGHSLKRGARTTGAEFDPHTADVKRLGRHESSGVLGEYLEFGDLFERHTLGGVAYRAARVRAGTTARKGKGKGKGKGEASGGGVPYWPQIGFDLWAAEMSQARIGKIFGLQIVELTAVNSVAGPARSSGQGKAYTSSADPWNRLWPNAHWAPKDGADKAS